MAAFSRAWAISGSTAARWQLSFTITLISPYNAVLGASTATVTISDAQLAQGTPKVPISNTVLTVDQLTPIVKAAETRWIAAGYSAAKFSGVQCVIANMGHGVLGNTSASVITTDASAGADFRD